MSAQLATTDKIQSKKEGGIGWLIFNNPEKRNAVSLEMSQAAAAVIEDFAANSAVRVIVLRGTGDKSFISGGDISQFEKERSTPEARANYEKIRARARKLLVA